MKTSTKSTIINASSLVISGCASYTATYGMMMLTAPLYANPYTKVVVYVGSFGVGIASAAIVEKYSREYMESLFLTAEELSEAFDELNLEL